MIGKAVGVVFSTNSRSNGEVSEGDLVGRERSGRCRGTLACDQLDGIHERALHFFEQEDA